MSKEFTWSCTEIRASERSVQPAVTIFVPTFNRPIELSQCIESIAAQITADLEAEVQLIISDNASRPDHISIIRHLAEKYPFIDYYLHAENGLTLAQLSSAPWRAKGRWLWIFGDDDLLLPGGVQHIIDILKSEEPAFLSLNRVIVDVKLERVVRSTKNDCPSARFDSFIDLLKNVGVDQLSFLSTQIANTEEFRQIDIEKYMRTTCSYFQIASYLDAYHAHSAYYDSHAFVVHRWNTEPESVTTHSNNFFHLSVTLPALMAEVRDQHRLPKDLFETISGAKFLKDFAPSKITFVDNILEYLWRNVGMNMELAQYQWDLLTHECENWRPERRKQFEEVYTFSLEQDRLRHELSAMVEQFQTELADPASGHARGRLQRAMMETDLQARAKQLDLRRREAMQRADTYCNR